MKKIILLMVLLISLLNAKEEIVFSTGEFDTQTPFLIWNDKCKVVFNNGYVTTNHIDKNFICYSMSAIKRAFSKTYIINNNRIKEISIKDNNMITFENDKFFKKKKSQRKRLLLKLDDKGALSTIRKLYKIPMFAKVKFNYKEYLFLKYFKNEEIPSIDNKSGFLLLAEFDEETYLARKKYINDIFYGPYQKQDRNKDYEFKEPVKTFETEKVEEPTKKKKKNSGMFKNYDDWKMPDWAQEEINNKYEVSEELFETDPKYKTPTNTKTPIYNDPDYIDPTLFK